MMRLRSSRRNSCRAHSGLIREDAASDTVLKHDQERGSGEATDRSRSGECVLHDQGKRGGDFSNVQPQDDQAATHVQYDH